MKLLENRTDLSVMSFGIAFIVVATILYGVLLPDLDNKIVEKNQELDNSKQSFYIANSYYTNGKVHGSTIYVLTQLLNITDVNLVFSNSSFFWEGTYYNPGNYVKFVKDGEVQFRGGNEEIWERLIKNLIDYGDSVAGMILSYCNARGNCTLDEADNITNVADIGELTNMIKPYAQSVVDNMNEITSEINKLESRRSQTQILASFFQIIGIIIIQISGFLFQKHHKNK